MLNRQPLNQRNYLTEDEIEFLYEEERILYKDEDIPEYCQDLTKDVEQPEVEYDDIIA